MPENNDFNKERLFKSAFPIETSRLDFHHRIYPEGEPIRFPSLRLLSPSASRILNSQLKLPLYFEGSEIRDADDIVIMDVKLFLPGALNDAIMRNITNLIEELCKTST